MFPTVLPFLYTQTCSGPLYSLFLWSLVSTVSLVICTHCSSGPLYPLVLCAHCSSGPLYPLVLCSHCSSGPLFPLFLCSHCFSGPLYPLVLCAHCSSGPLYPLVLCTHCSTGSLYPLFHWSSVPTVPLVLCAHCSTGPLCPLFLWSPVSTVPLFYGSHCATGPRFHWSTVPLVHDLMVRFIGLGLLAYWVQRTRGTTNSLCLPLVLCAHCLLTLCTPLTLPFCYTYLLIISYFRTRYMILFKMNKV